MIFPQIKEPDKNGYIRIVNPAVRFVGGEDNKTAENLMRKKGILFCDDGNIIVLCEKENSLRKEEYIISVSCEKNDTYEVKIIFGESISLFHAINTLKNLLKKGILPKEKITDRPSFEIRGFIEGFYGKPWGKNGRKKMLELLSENHINTYFYAPKDDLYHREKWDELYPEDKLEEMKELVETAKENYLNLNYCVGPGLSICYSDEKMMSSLTEKYRQLYNIGVTSFGLFLDDIPESFLHENDEKMFASLVDAHIYFINKCYEKLKNIDERITLTVCPWQYHGKGNEDYITSLGRGINSEINLFWTGRNICSQELLCEEAERFEKATGRKPLYWDNYPVNDADMFHEMHIGPIEGRDKELSKFCKGLISNPMEYCESSKISLLTIADYLWNSEAYDSEKSWDNALDIIVGKDKDKFIYFADNLLVSCLQVTNSPIMCDVFSKMIFCRAFGKYDELLCILDEYRKKMNGCLEYIKGNDTPLLKELKCWADKFSLCCKILDKLSEFFATRSVETKNELHTLMEEYNYNPFILTDFCFREFVEYTVENEYTTEEK